MILIPATRLVCLLRTFHSNIETRANLTCI
jgi:hypothetical protein